MRNSSFEPKCICWQKSIFETLDFFNSWIVICTKMYCFYYTHTHTERKQALSSKMSQTLWLKGRDIHLRGGRFTAEQSTLSTKVNVTVNSVTAVISGNQFITNGNCKFIINTKLLKRKMTLISIHMIYSTWLYTVIMCQANLSWIVTVIKCIVILYLIEQTVSHIMMNMEVIIYSFPPLPPHHCINHTLCLFWVNAYLHCFSTLGTS